MKTNILKICETFGLFSLFNVFTKNRAMVFMMHHFNDGHGRDGGSLSAATLDESLNYLRVKGYSVISLSAFVQALIDGAPLYKTVVFTVDDGYRDFYDHAYPVFKSYGMAAAVFLATDFIDGKTVLWWDRVRDAVAGSKSDALELAFGDRKFRYSLRSDSERDLAVRHITDQCKRVPDGLRCAVLDQLAEKGNGCLPKAGDGKAPLCWDQIVEMQRHRIEFYPHTMTHPVLAQCEPDAVRREIAESKKAVQHKVNHRADIFCYPNGTLCDFDDTVIALLKQEGYRAAVTAEEGFDDSCRPNDLFRLRRYPFPSDRLRFKQLVSGLEGLKQTLRQMHG